MAEEGATEKKVNAAGIAAVVAALAAGGGGVGLLSGSAELQREMEKLTQDITDIRAEASAEELRVVAMVAKADDDSAARGRRIRDEMQKLIDRLEAQVHDMQLGLAREDR
jgi:uncharacterized protein HemX